MTKLPSFDTFLFPRYVFETKTLGTIGQKNFRRRQGYWGFSWIGFFIRFRSLRGFVAHSCRSLFSSSGMRCGDSSDFCNWRNNCVWSSLLRFGMISSLTCWSFEGSSSSSLVWPVWPSIFDGLMKFYMGDPFCLLQFIVGSSPLYTSSVSTISTFRSIKTCLDPETQIVIAFVNSQERSYPTRYLILSLVTNFLDLPRFSLRIW